MTLILITAAGCVRQTAVDPAPLRPVLDRAVAGLRPYNPEAAATIDVLRQHAEEKTAANAAAPFWRRRTADADAAWEAVVTEAARRTKALAQATRAGRASWEVSLAAANGKVEQARQKLPTPGMGSFEAASLRRAEILLSSALELAAAGRLEAAAAAADQAAASAAIVERSWLEQHDRFNDQKRRLGWNRLMEDAVDVSRRTRSAAIVVDKLARRLLLFESGRLALAVPAEIGANGLQRKRYAGDRATPEGAYHITTKKKGAATRYYKAFLIDYPNREDLRRFRAGQADGTIPPGVGPGNLIEIHGGGGSGRDWTDGCIALGDEAMDLLYDRVTVSTPVIIVGTVDHHAKAAKSR